MDLLTKNTLKEKFGKKPNDKSINIDIIELLTDIREELRKFNSK